MVLRHSSQLDVNAPAVLLPGERWSSELRYWGSCEVTRAGSGIKQRQFSTCTRRLTFDLVMLHLSRPFLIWFVKLSVIWGVPNRTKDQLCLCGTSAFDPYIKYHTSSQSCWSKQLWVIMSPRKQLEKATLEAIFITVKRSQIWSGNLSIHPL